MPDQDTLLPAEENERLEQLAELARLRAEVKELSKARYVRGPEGCTDDAECEEYWLENGESAAIEWCSHVEHGIATLADVVRAERLEALVNEMRGLAERAPENALAGQILDTIAHQMEQVELATQEVRGG